MTIWVDLRHANHRRTGKRFKTRLIEQGSGEAVIFLHGTGGHAEAFSRNFAGMAPHFHLYAMDLLWHGMSEKPRFEGKTIEPWVEQVIDMMDAEGIASAHIVGESLGGWVGIFLALAHPSRVRSLTLNTTGGVKLPDEMLHAADLDALRNTSIAAIGQPTPQSVRKRLEWLMASPDRVTDELVELRLAYYSDPEVREGLTHVFNTQFNPGFREKYELDAEQLKPMTCPTLVLWTDRNPHRDEQAGRRIAAQIPNARFYLMKDAAHWPQWEKPAEHNQVVMDFLRGVR